MSHFDIGGISGKQENLVIGDHAVVTSYGSAPPELAELANRVDQHAGTIQEIEAVLAELRTELERQPVRRERVRELLATLTAGGGALTAVVDGIEQVRQSLGAS